MKNIKLMTKLLALLLATIMITSSGGILYLIESTSKVENSSINGLFPSENKIDQILNNDKIISPYMEKLENQLLTDYIDVQDNSEISNDGLLSDPKLEKLSKSIQKDNTPFQKEEISADLTVWPQVGDTYFLHPDLYPFLTSNTDIPLGGHPIFPGFNPDHPYKNPNGVDSNSLEFLMYRYFAYQGYDISPLDLELLGAILTDGCDGSIGLSCPSSPTGNILMAHGKAHLDAQTLGNRVTNLDIMMSLLNPISFYVYPYRGYTIIETLWTDMSKEIWCASPANEQADSGRDYFVRTRIFLNPSHITNVNCFSEY